MAEPWSIRLNDKNSADRSERFFQAVGERLVDPVEVVKHLVEAWMRYNETHGKPPKFPVTIIAADDVSSSHESTPPKK